MKLLSKGVYKTYDFEISHNGYTYYAQCQEDDVCDTWYISKDGEGDIGGTEEAELIKEFCRRNMQ